VRTSSRGTVAAVVLAAAVVTSVIDGTGQAAVRSKEIPRPPTADAISAGALNVAVRASLASGAEYLLRAVETNFLHYAAAPVSNRKPIGWDRIETNYVHYRWEEYEAPRYEHIYEEYETFAVGASGSVEARKIGKVTRRRVVGRKKVGTVTKKRLVKDPDGPVVRTHKKGIGPRYGPGKETWPDQLPGDNALALLALLKSGVPETDERLRKLAGALDDYVTYYGASDLTRNVALLAAAFSNLSDPQYKDSRDLLISRILDGQIASGPARGMWGPVCINMEMLPVLVKHESEIGKALAALKAELPKKLAKTRSEKREAQLEAEVERAEEKVRKMESLYNRVTQQGMRFERVTQPFSLKVESWDADTRLTAGLPYYIYNQTFADLESTAVALYAIGEAAAKGCLPEETQVPTLPTLDESGRSRGSRSRSDSVLKPQNTSGLLARAVAALAKKQERDGGWRQCNIHQESRTFEALGLPRLKQEEMPAPLESVRTRATVAQGYASLLNAGKAVGIAKLMGKYGCNLLAARGRVAEEAAAHLDRKGEPVIPVGRMLRPYDLYFSMLGVHRSVDPLVEDRRDLWMRFAHEIVELQDDTGVWEKKPARGWTLPDIRLHPSSLWAWQGPRAKAAFEERMRKAGKAKTVAYDPKRHWPAYGLMGKRQHPHSRYEASNREVVATSLAMLFLADGVYPPIGGYVDLTGKGAPPTLLRAAFSALKSRDRLDPTVLRLSADNVRTSISSVPVVFLAGTSALDNRTVASAVRRYLQEDGVLVIECSTAGALAAAQETMLAELPGASVRSLPATADFMSDYRGTRPPLKALFAADKRMVALFVPATAKYIQVVYLLAKHAAGEECLDPRYPTLYFGEDPFLARVRALSALRGLAAPPPATPQPVVEKPVSEPAEESPAAKDTTPEDEKW